LTNEGFHEALNRFEARFEFDRYRPESPSYRWHESERPVEENLLAALSAIEVEREKRLEDLRIFAQQRKWEKVRRRSESANHHAD
jgi:hypothetical protein